MNTDQSPTPFHRWASDAGRITSTTLLISVRLRTIAVTRRNHDKWGFAAAVFALAGYTLRAIGLERRRQGLTTVRPHPWRRHP